MAQILAYTKKSLAKLQKFLKLKCKRFIRVHKFIHVRGQKANLHVKTLCDRYTP